MTKPNQFTVASPLILELDRDHPELLNVIADVYNTAETDNKLNFKANASDVTTSLNDTQATLTAGTASLGSQSFLSEATIKHIINGLGISLFSDANGIVLTGRDAYTKTKADSLLNAKATATNVFTKDETYDS